MPQIRILVYYVLLNSVMMCLLYRIFMDLTLPLLVLFVSCLRNPFLSQHHKGIPFRLFLAGIYCWVVWGEFRIWLFSRVNPLSTVDWNAHPSLSICNASVRTYEFPHLPGVWVESIVWRGPSLGPMSNCPDHPSFMGNLALWQSTSLLFLPSQSHLRHSGNLLFHVNFRICLCDFISHVKPCWHVN